VFRHAAERLLAGQAVYRFDEVFAFKYSPFAALLLTPLGLGTPLVAYWCWNALNAFAYAAFVAWAGIGRQGFAVVLAFASLLVLVQHHFALGQIDMLLLAGFALSERSRFRHAFFSGIVLGLLPFLKLPFLLLWALPFVHGEPLRAGGIGAGVLLGLLLPALAFGIGGDIEMHRAWLATLAQNTAPIVCWRDNQGAFSLPCAFGLTPSFGILLIAAVILAWLFFKNHRDPAVALFAVHFLSPLAWCTALVGALPLIADFIAFARGWQRLAFIALILAALASRELLGGDGYTRFLELRMYAFLYTPVIILGCIARRRALY
jgi:hypothetical protein